MSENNRPADEDWDFDFSEDDNKRSDDSGSDVFDPSDFLTFGSESEPKEKAEPSGLLGGDDASGEVAPVGFVPAEEGDSGEVAPAGFVSAEEDSGEVTAAGPVAREGDSGEVSPFGPVAPEGDSGEVSPGGPVFVGTDSGEVTTPIVERTPETVKPKDEPKRKADKPSGGGFLKVAGVGIVCAALGGGGTYALINGGGKPTTPGGVPAKPPASSGADAPKTPDETAKGDAPAAKYDDVRRAVVGGDLKEATKRVAELKKANPADPEVESLEADILERELDAAPAPGTSSVRPVGDLLASLMIALEPGQGPADPRREKLAAIVAKRLSFIANTKDAGRKAQEQAKLAANQAELAATYLPADPAEAEKVLADAKKSLTQAEAAPDKTAVAALSEKAGLSIRLVDRGVANAKLATKALADERARLAAFAADVAKATNGTAPAQVDAAALGALTKTVADVAADRTLLAGFAGDVAKALDPNAAQAKPDAAALTARSDAVANLVKQRKADADSLGKWSTVADGLTKSLKLTKTAAQDLDAWTKEANERIATLGKPQADLLASLDAEKKKRVTAEAEVTELKAANMGLQGRNTTLAAEAKQLKDKAKLADDRLGVWAGFAGKIAPSLDLGAAAPGADADPSTWTAAATPRIVALAKPSPASNLLRGEREWARRGESLADLAHYQTIPADRWAKIPDATTEAWLDGLVEAVRLGQHQVVPVAVKAKADRLYYEGAEAFLGRRYDQAVERLDKAIAAFPFDARYYYYRGLARQLGEAGGVDRTVESAAVDMRFGARVEAIRRPDPREIGRALEPIQHPVRGWVESFRQSGLTPEPVTAPATVAGLSR